MKDLQIVLVELQHRLDLRADIAGILEPVREREQERFRHKLADYTLYIQEVGGATHGVRLGLHQWTNQRSFIKRAA